MRRFIFTLHHKKLKLFKKINMKRSKKLDNTDYKKIGFYHIDLIKMIGQITKPLVTQKKMSKNNVVILLTDLLDNPEQYYENEIFGELAKKVTQLQPNNALVRQEQKGFELKTETPTYPIFGKEYIEPSALGQMNIAMRLPISVAGALMPDAHHGYGLPIGGVLATEGDKVIPYAVGVDIACRMCMSIFPVNATVLSTKTQELKNHLLKNSVFGTGQGFEKPLEDELFDRDVWQSFKFIRDLKLTAMRQVGSSGTGNHFVEWGYVDILQFDAELNLPEGKYLALLSHSGSRGLGANIAGEYSKIAMSKTKLPDEAKHLAWLDLNTQEGQEYWVGMHLAGDYASANHHHIHKRMALALGMQPVKMIENHHNFAWKQTLKDGREVITHRKGATPAGKGEWGIIPASMTSAGCLVKGKGEESSLYSASHGAGRQMSRTQAFKNITDSDLKRMLAEYGVTLIGADLDEAPMAYKDIDQVMHAQTDLVDVVARFYPKIVRMADKEPKKPWTKKKPSAGLDFTES